MMARNQRFEPGGAMMAMNQRFEPEFDWRIPHDLGECVKRQGWLCMDCELEYEDQETDWYNEWPDLE